MPPCSRAASCCRLASVSSLASPSAPIGAGVPSAPCQIVSNRVSALVGRRPVFSPEEGRGSARVLAPCGPLRIAARMRCMGHLPPPAGRCRCRPVVARHAVFGVAAPYGLLIGIASRARDVSLVGYHGSWGGAQRRRRSAFPGIGTRGGPMIKLIASDMDGTLLDEHGEVPPETFELIVALRERGIHFAASSGRRYDRLCQ
ncbi:HAD family hydrolase, partial [Collinsella sp. D33t1_170424_A12]|uniref:HAD family hydrolase n=1 Tax=Collinsella sp. D33t1_170424_A12 TaxID=2787135 RepID=UPI00351C8FE0